MKLANDDVPRIVRSANEVNAYVAGDTEHIGDVDRSWVRLENPDRTTYVMGESHGDRPDALDVVRGVGTSRFLYEGFHVLPQTKGLKLTGTRKLLSEEARTKRPTPDERDNYPPALENLVLKIARSLPAYLDFVQGDEDDRSLWKEHPESKYSGYERTAVYFMWAIRVAKDLSGARQGTAAAELYAVYLKDRKLFDQMEEVKAGNKGASKDHTPGLWLMMGEKTSGLGAVKEFIARLQPFCAEYLRALGKETGKEHLEEAAKVVEEYDSESNDNDFTNSIDKAREAGMLDLMRGLKGRYLVIGMGNEHQESLRDSKLAGVRWHYVKEWVPEQGKRHGQQYERMNEARSRLDKLDIQEDVRSNNRIEAPRSPNTGSEQNGEVPLSVLGQLGNDRVLDLSGLGSSGSKSLETSRTSTTYRTSTTSFLDGRRPKYLAGCATIPGLRGWSS